MKNWNAKRRLLIGLLIAGTFGGAALAAHSLQQETVYSSDPLVRQLQTLYGNVTASRIQISKLESLPVEGNELSPEQREQRLAEIGQELKQHAEEQGKYQTAAADTEQAIKAVEADFSRGVLSAGDKEMLLKLFSDKRDGYRRVLAETDRKNADLNKEKQQIANYRQPDRIEYGQARVDTGKSLITHTIFYNATEQRLLTNEEMAAHPAVSQILKRLPDAEERKPNEYPLYAGIAASGLLAVLTWRLLPGRNRSRVPEFLRQGT